MRKLIWHPLIVAIVLLAASSAKAQHEPVYTSLLAGDSIYAGKALTVQDTVFFNPLLKPSIRNTMAVNNMITLRINEASEIHLPDSFTVQVRVRLYYENEDNLQDSVANDTLFIDYHKDRRYSQRSTRLLHGAYWMQVKILSVQITQPGGADVLRNLELENRLVIDRNFEMSCTDNAIQTILKDTSTVSTLGELTVYWTPDKTVEWYDLEWTWVDQSAWNAGLYHNGDPDAPDAAKIFRNNASRISTKASSYKIPLLYDGTGILFYRVRGAQEETDGEITTTNWSSDYTESGGLGSYAFNGHERPLNWQATTSFAEEGKRKSVVQYYDGSLMARQTVTKDNTTGTTVVAETLYDQQGRPAIQILPAPTISTLLKYTPGFNVVDMNSKEYDKGIYDTLLTAADYCNIQVDSMSVVSGASKYYSGSNPLVNTSYHRFIPDAKGYAFAVTQYSQDNTGRIKRQGGVGKDFQPGSGHETKYYYGKPDQTELDALFGTEVGEASHYQKNMVRDANGQYSISYIDMHGRTIATALAGNTPAALQQLASFRDSVQTDSMLNARNNIITGSTIQSTQSLMMTKAGSVTFNYGLGAESLTLENCRAQNICYDCLYDLTITITDDCNNQLLGGAPLVIRKSNFRLFEIDTTCATATPMDTSFTVSLEEGSYMVTKKLTVSQDAMNYYRDSVFMVQNTCKTYQDFYEEQMDSIRTRMDCSEDSLNTTQSQTMRDQMLMDLYPLIGQYADTTSSTNWLSIFNTGTGGRYLYQQVADTGYYKNEEGNADLVYNTAGNLVAPQLLTPEEFIYAFKDSWLDNLLSLHPEYCLLQQYQRFETSHARDKAMEETDTYAQALAKGYLNPTASTSTAPANQFTINGIDPLFTEWPAAKTAIENALLNFHVDAGTSTTVSAWGFATVAAKCADVSGGSCATTYNTNSNVFDAGTLCTGELDMAWRIFRSIYLEKKRLWIEEQMRSVCAIAYPEAPLVSVFPHHEQMLLEIGQDAGAPDINQGNAQLAAYFTSTCQGYVDVWKEKLAGCGYTEPQMAVVTNYLVNVCREGSDLQHVLGSSTVKPGSGYRFSSFEQVIKFVNDSLGRPTNSMCNGFLLTNPLPYSQSVPVVNKPIMSKPDSCDCATINTHYTQYQAVSGSYTNFSDYLSKKVQVTLRQGELDTLRGLCNNTITCKYIPTAITLPPSLQCGGMTVCITCTQYTAAYDSFRVKFPDVLPSKTENDSATHRYNVLFESFMNSRLGMTQSAYDYLAFSDSCGIVPAGPLPGDTVLDCSDFTYFLHQYYKRFIHPTDSNTVDLDMRTFAGNITPAEGPKGVFDINGDLIGNTIDGTTSAINSSYATIWNSSVVNQVVGELSALSNGRFRLTLNPGQTAPCNGIVGQRYYQYEAHPLDSIAGRVVVGNGTYIDFGDDTRLFLQSSSTTVFAGNVINDARNIVDRSDYSGFYGDNKYYMADRTPTRFFSVQHKYFKPIATRQTYTVTIYHAEVRGVAGFVAPRTTMTDSLTALQTNLRGYFPQQLIMLLFQSTQDSTICRTREIKNFNQINTIEFLEMSNRQGPIFHVNIGNLENNHNMKYVYYCPAYVTIPDYKTPGYLDAIAGRTMDEFMPNLPVNFPNLGYLVVNGLNHWEYKLDAISFALPKLRHFSFVHFDTILPRQIDTLLNQVARVNNQTGGTGFYSYGITSPGMPTAASAAARNKLMVDNGWSIWSLNSGQVHVNTNAGNRFEDLSPLLQSNAFTDMVNAATGAHYNWKDLQQMYYLACGDTINLCEPPTLNNDTTQRLCATPVANELQYVHLDPCGDSTVLATMTATALYQAYTDSLKAAFDEAYLQKCLQAVNLETFTVTKPVSEYHHTLYYYDLAGNLTKTIPPEAVVPNRYPAHLAAVKAARAAGTRLAPSYELPTMYHYNSLNQVVLQRTPDAGLSRFWYDRLGRLVVSQNAKQYADSKYSFTRYDFLGRITQVGEKLNDNTAMTQTVSRSETSLASWLNYNMSNTAYRPKQLTATVYDIISPDAAVYDGFTDFAQKAYTLRNRVSYTALYESPTYLNPSPGVYTLDESVYSASTEYSYDIHGNVDRLLNKYGGTTALADHGDNKYKVMQYKYDLISGKVNQVHYQPGKNDELYHRYEYDADNKLTDVYVTDEKAFIGQPQLEEHDAFYRYYKHGPLARTVLGQQQVQGVDNAYTLQGWLKGVNSMVANYTHDMGQDGLVTGKDAYGFQLNYFTNDYAAIKPGVEPFPGHTAYMGTEYKELFNGNISSMGVNINQFNQPQLYNYRYDQLNRIVRMDTYRGFNSSTNSWSGLTHTNDYRERVSYDANGNIKTYSRYGTTAGGSPLQMDSLTYGYNIDDEKLLNNKLRHVKDAIADGNYSIDIDGQDDDNYEYDAIGNLVSDAKEGIDAIEWTVYGKIAKIEKANGTEINYSYDVSGNRITKAVTTGEGTAYTSYVRDASGNVMAVYEQAAGQETMHLKEQHLYGSSRLGLWNRNQDIDQQNKWRTDNANLLGSTARLNFERGYKLFELSNHLGNVLATVSDKKLATVTDMVYPHGGEAFEAVLEWGADVVTANDYYPGGMGMPGRTFSSTSQYRYGFNGQEKSSEINENSYTAKYWEYDSRIGRRWNKDPKPVTGISPYATFNNNPIWHIDPLGDSSIIDNKGYMVHYDKNDKDLRVFMQQDGKLSLIGELGKNIDANGWYKNLLEGNSKRADDINNPWTFKNFVKKNGRWDYKNLNESNDRVKKGELKSHILGVAFYRKDKETNSSADLSDTYFSFDGMSGRSEDINNHHFGVVGKATGLFGETTMLKAAGAAEMGKWKDEGKQVPASWRPTIRVTKSYYIEHGMKVTETEEVLQAPYGDNPVDHEWIKKGFKYYDRNRRNLDGDWW